MSKTGATTPVDGGVISDEEYLSDRTEKCNEDDIEQVEVLSVSDEMNDAQNPTNEESDFDPNYDEESDKSEEDSKAFVTNSPRAWNPDEVIEIESSESSDEPELPDVYSNSDTRSDTNSPLGKTLYKFKSYDPKNPTFPRTDEQSYEITYPPTPPSSENGKAPRSRRRQRKNAESLERASSSSSEQSLENGVKKQRRTRKPTKLKKTHENMQRLISENNSDVVAETKTPVKPFDTLKQAISPSPLKVDAKRYVASNPRTTQIIDAQPSPFKSFKGHKAPSIISRTNQVSKAKALPTHRNIFRENNKSFGNSTTLQKMPTTTVKESIQATKTEQANCQEKPKFTARVKMANISRNDKLLEEMCKSQKPPNNKVTEPKPGPSKEFLHQHPR